LLMNFSVGPETSRLTYGAMPEVKTIAKSEWESLATLVMELRLFSRWQNQNYSW